MERFIREEKLPSFGRFYRESHVFTTESDADAPNLEPWIQWITVHTGLPYREHGVFNLGDGYRLREKSVWDLLSDSGRKVWVCGSMNVQYKLPIRGWVLPDPWMIKVAPHPADELQPYVRFVGAHVLEHTLDQVSLTTRERLRFIGFMARHGLSLDSVVAIARQLVSERLRPQPARWRRSGILDRLQFDLFRWVYLKERPDFSTFFSNSTAHFQHVYWRNMEPERFQVKPTADEQAQYEHAILYGYQQMDELLGRFMRLAADDATLVFCTALSQQPCLVYEDSGGKRWYRPRDFDRFLRDVGVTAPARVSPVMAHQFHIDFEDEQAAAEAEAQLGALHYPSDRQAMLLIRSGQRIFAGCRVLEEVRSDAAVTVTGSGRSIPFFQLFHRVAGLKSGMHHPDGLLWIRTTARQHHVDRVKVPLVSVAPTLLEMFAIPKPDYMQGEPIMRRRECAA